MADEEKEDVAPEEGASEPDKAGVEGVEESNPEKDSVEAAAEEAMLAAMAEEQQLAGETGLDDLHKALGEGGEQDMLANSDEPAGEKAASGVPEINNPNLSLLIDVGLQVSVELGRRDMSFGDILQLGRGSVVELNKLADEPVDIYVNQSKIAEGEVVVVDEHFGVRITRLISSERLKKVG